MKIYSFIQYQNLIFPFFWTNLFASAVVNSVVVRGTFERFAEDNRGYEDNETAAQ